jgi:hypothetical protein
LIILIGIVLYVVLGLQILTFKQLFRNIPRDSALISSDGVLLGIVLMCQFLTFKKTLLRNTPRRKRRRTMEGALIGIEAMSLAIVGGKLIQTYMAL